MTPNKSLLIFVHFNPSHQVSEDIFFLLHSFKKESIDIIFISTSPLTNTADRTRLASLTVSYHEVPNVGYDFFNWAQMLLRMKSDIMSRYTRVILMNSTMMGPVSPLSNFLQAVNSNIGDIVGATLSKETHPHLQSYFLYFKEKVLHSDFFWEFWSSIEAKTQVQDIINTYEINLSTQFKKAGFTIGSYYTAHSHRNPTLHHPYRLLFSKMPFIKVRLLRDNPKNTWIWPLKCWLNQIKKIPMRTE